jgi:hypothetical protein
MRNMMVTEKQNYFEAHGKFWQWKNNTLVASQI